MRFALALIGLSLLVGCSSRTASSADRWVARNGGCCDIGTSRLERVGGRFATVVDQPLSFKVLDRSDLRAYSFPSGEVIVTRGLMDALTDDEVAAVIGHEIGHLLHDGHATAAALTGRHEHGDAESAADAASVSLLRTMDVPAASMRTTLQKVQNSLPADSSLRPALARRISALP